MNYKLTTPCDACPFLLGSGFTYARLMQHASGEFGCHKACELRDDGDGEGAVYKPKGDKTPHCAGALIFLLKQGQSHQMMRICERIGLFDPSKLNMDAPVGSRPSDYGRDRRR